jgi:hypothetical protein
MVYFPQSMKWKIALSALGVLFFLSILGAAASPQKQVAGSKTVAFTITPTASPTPKITQVLTVVYATRDEGHLLLRNPTRETHFNVKR